MKRALAERAKQATRAETTIRAPPSLMMSANHTVVSSASNDADVSPVPADPPAPPFPPPSSKQAKVEPETTTSTTTTAASRKRPRTTHSSNDLSAGADDSSAFYLKHQNRALAVELQSIKHELSQVKQEREARRQECETAAQALFVLQNTWTRLEQALGYSSTATTSHDITTTTASTSSTTLSSSSSSCVPPSSGVSGVEWTRALTAALATVAGTTDTRNLAAVSHNLSQRARVLQQHLLAAHGVVVEPTTDDLSKIPLLEHQVAELKQARQAAKQSERKVRRNVYRLEANMITLPQLLKAIEQEDDIDRQEIELQLQTIMSQLQNSASSALTTTTTTTTTSAPVPVPTTTSSSNFVSNEQVTALRAQITNLERTVASRNESIQEVGAVDTQ